VNVAHDSFTMGSRWDCIRHINSAIYLGQRRVTVSCMAIYALGDIEPEIHPTAFIHPQCTIIGAVRIGANSSVWPHAVLRGDEPEPIVVGERTSIQDGSVVHTTTERSTIVGNDCVIGHLAHLEACTIEDGALVGSNSVVLHRAVVSSGALVGAGALVPNDMVVPSGAMALGVPAKIRLDSVSEEMLRDSAAAYVDRNLRYRDELRRID
jgi:carbonic anhydrase/acetyltransferase-like protein (isoleucine patch superfamily)